VECSTSTTEINLISTATSPIPNTRIWPSSDFREHWHEVEVRLESAAGIAASALLGEMDRDAALEALIGMLEVSSRHLRAAVAS